MQVRDVWFGASDSATEGTFRWVDGPEVGQVVSLVNGFWYANQPDNTGGDEDCLMIYQGKFNDATCSSSYTLNYLVEYGPDPGSMFLVKL